MRTCNASRTGDITLLNEQETGGETGSAFAGELFRAHLRRAAEEGEVARLQRIALGNRRRLRQAVASSRRACRLLCLPHSPR